MTVPLPDLIASMDALGVRLDVELVIDAPPGILTPAVVAILQEHRNRLILHLARERQWESLRAQRWGEAGPEPGIERRGRGRADVIE